MITKWLTTIFGTSTKRDLKRMEPLKNEINRLEEGLQNLSDEALREKTAAWKAELSAIEDDAELTKRLDDILPETFAVVKNACRRLCGQTINVKGHELKWEMVPFDVQMIGGMVLHNGQIAEMATGEGKTLVATAPVYLNALSGRGVHVVTVNDYLAARDSDWMGAVYKFLGLSVGCIQHALPPSERRVQYNCDITYGTNSEFGFDYLRDNGMATRAQDQVQRGHFFAIVDEVDSILIDEARTPLIISGPATVDTDNDLYDKLKPGINGLVRAQEKLTQQWLNEAKKLLEKREGTEANTNEIDSEIGRLLLRVKNGRPRWDQFLRLMEDAAIQKMVQSFEMTLHTDQTKKELYAEKEELFYAIDEKGHDADLTEKGRNFLSPNEPDAFMLPDLPTQLHEIESKEGLDAKTRLEEKNTIQSEYETVARRIHCTGQLLKAYSLYEKDVQYVIIDNKVVIVDENTGRQMPGRRWSDGLHQAVEAKENVTIEGETQTYATVTIQNYFRLYNKLAGMTGTAETEAEEFLDIYKMGVLPIPTNREVKRSDYNDSVYKSKREKNHAILEEIRGVHQEGRPILVGTVSVESSEQLSRILNKAGLPHSVLNAKYHEKEAEIVTRAGQRGAITIATNMAGRGTDIKLGTGVSELGGLHVIGTERHESRRIDRQLRGRCARQGDPGSSHFFISLEDTVMRLFANDRMIKIMESLGMEEGMEIAHPMLNKSIESAQKKVEQHHFQMRKRTLEFDDVLNKQREAIYGFRTEVLKGDDIRDQLLDIMEEVVISKVQESTSAEIPVDEWNVRTLADWVNINFPIALTEEEIKNVAADGKEDPVKDSAFGDMSVHQFAICVHVVEEVRKAYELKISFEDDEAIQSIERYTMLSAIDKLWQEHLYNMDSLRTAISLRAIGQKDPLIEYKREAFHMFEEMEENIKTEVCHNIFRSASSLQAFEQFLTKLPKKATHQTSNTLAEADRQESNAKKANEMVSQANQAVEKIKSKPKPIRTGPKVGRNDPCPCGSGKKYKQCCGKAGS